MTVKKDTLNQEIVSIISEHGTYIDQDPMVLFYSMYYCIYYKNPDIV